MRVFFKVTFTISGRIDERNKHTHQSGQNKKALFPEGKTLLKVITALSIADWFETKGVQNMKNNCFTLFPAKRKRGSTSEA
jgi:hypothetical protein